MSTIKQQMIDLLMRERKRIVEELEEVDLHLSLLDVEVDAPTEPQPSATPETRRGRGGSGPTIEQRQIEDARKIVTLLSQNGPRSVRDVAAHLGISRPQANRKLLELMGQGRVKRHMRSMKGQPSGSGKAPWLYELVPVVDAKEHHIDSKSGVVID